MLNTQLTVSTAWSAAKMFASTTSQPIPLLMYIEKHNLSDIGASVANSAPSLSESGAEPVGTQILELLVRLLPVSLGTFHI